MAARDIMPYAGPHPSYARVAHYRMNAAETFLQGEPVSVNADGELTESADDPQDADIMGIAVAGPGDGTPINPDTGVAYATGDIIGVYLPDPTTYFVTPNYSEAGAAFNDTAPVVARIGDECGLSLIGGSWGVDISAANNTCRIVDILDDLGRSIQRTGATLATTDDYTVVFCIVAHQMIPMGAVDAPAA